jgi:hypothetical protein
MVHQFSEDLDHASGGREPGGALPRDNNVVVAAKTPTSVWERRTPYRELDVISNASDPEPARNSPRAITTRHPTVEG